MRKKNKQHKKGKIECLSLFAPSFTYFFSCIHVFVKVKICTSSVITNDTNIQNLYHCHIKCKNIRRICLDLVSKVVQMTFCGDFCNNPGHHPASYNCFTTDMDYYIYIHIYNLHFLNNKESIKNNVITPTDTCFLANTNFYSNWTSKLLTMNVHDEGYSRNATFVVRSTQ